MFLSYCVGDRVGKWSWKAHNLGIRSYIYHEYDYRIDLNVSGPFDYTYCENVDLEDMNDGHSCASCYRIAWGVMFHQIDLCIVNYTQRKCNWSHNISNHRIAYHHLADNDFCHRKFELGGHIFVIPCIEVNPCIYDNRTSVRLHTMNTITPTIADSMKGDTVWLRALVTVGAVYISTTAEMCAVPASNDILFFV